MARPHSVNTELPTQYTVPKHVYAIGKCIDRISNALPINYKQGFIQCYYQQLTIHGISQTLYLPFSSPSNILNTVRQSVRYALDKVILVESDRSGEMKMRIMAMFDALLDCLEDILDPISSLNIPSLAISTESRLGSVPMACASSSESNTAAQSYAVVARQAGNAQGGTKSTRTSQKPTVNTAGTSDAKKEQKARDKKPHLEPNRLSGLKTNASSILDSCFFDFCKIPGCPKCIYLLGHWPLTACTSRCNHPDIGGWFVHFTPGMRKLLRRSHASTTLDQIREKTPREGLPILGDLTGYPGSSSCAGQSCISKLPAIRKSGSETEKAAKRKRLADNPSDWSAIVECASLSDSLSSLEDCGVVGNPTTPPYSPKAD